MNYDDDFIPPPPSDQLAEPTLPNETGLAASQPSEHGLAASKRGEGGSAPISTSDSSAPSPAESDFPRRTHRRNGTVARLPDAVRNQLNQMLLDGLTYRQIIENLGDNAKDLNEGHISEWKKGGYEDWLRQQERVEDLGATRDAALSLVKEKAGATVQDAARSIASAQMYELLLSFDPRSFAAALPEKPELYFRLVNALARLSEGEAVCSRLRAKATALERELETGQPGQAPGVISAEKLKEIIQLIKLL